MLNKLMIVLLSLSLGACVVYVEPHEGAYNDGYVVSKPQPPQPPRHRSISRKLMLTLAPSQAHRVGEGYLNKRLHYSGFEDVSLQRLEILSGHRQLWRADGLSGKHHLQRLMAHLAKDPLIIKVEHFHGHAVAPVPKPTKPVKPVKPVKYENMGLIIGLQPQATRHWRKKLLPSLRKKCLHKGESLKFQRSLASGGQLMLARVRDSEKREKALFRCLQKQPGISYVEENERRRIQGHDRDVERRRDVLR